jgi:hypothetical protein
LLARRALKNLKTSFLKVFINSSEGPMKQLPVAISLVLCEQVIVDEKSRNATPVNCFNLRELDAFPGQATFYALAWLTDGLGEMPIELLVQRLDTLEPVFRVERKLAFPDPLQELRCLVRIRDCAFPVPGYYEVALSVDGEMIAHRRFAVKREKE